MTACRTDKTASRLQRSGLRRRLRTLLGVFLAAESVAFLAMAAWLLCLLGYHGLLIGGVLAGLAVGLAWLGWRFFKAAHRRRFQFSLRTLLILVAVVSLGMGLLVKPLEEHRRRRAELRAYRLVDRLGGEVTVSYLEGDPAKVVTAHIRFNGIPLDGVDLQDLNDYPGFESLALTNTSVSQEVLRHLGGLKNLRSLDLSGSEFSNAALLSLRNLPGLTALTVKNTSFTDDSLKHLEGLKGLQPLFLDGTQVSDAGLPNLKSLPNLSALYLMNTSVTDAGLEGLKELKSLRYLFLYGTQVRYEAVGEFQDALSDCEVFR